jgi:uncharacterized membrane protein YagU involved in acid resistance
MGMRSAEGAPMLSVATAAVALEAIGLCVAVASNAIDDVNGRTATQSNAIGFMLFEFVFAVGVALIAWGVHRVQPWSRTPAVIVQVFTAMIAIWLLQAHRYDWGLPALLLALAGLAGLLAPASLRALNRRS